MTCISTIDIQTRLDVHELLNHFSHFLDHNRGSCWADLFTTDGVFECTDGTRLQGAAALATLPASVNARGHGAWRHLISAVVIERCNTRKELTVHAYCPVIDMHETGAMADFYDVDFKLRFGSRWRISHALARRVGTDAGADASAPALVSPALSQLVLQ